MLTWDFISGEMKHFHFSVWSISCNCLYHITLSETHCGCYFISVIWKNLNLISTGKISWKHYPKWNHMKENIWRYVNKIDGILLNESFISRHPRNEIQFISPAMKSNVDRICFLVVWNFFSGIFHFGSYVNNLLVWFFKFQCIK